MRKQAITTIYIPEDKIPIFEELTRIAKREGRSVSSILIEFIEEYVKKHGEGNPVIALDKFISGAVVKALPTLGHDPRRWNWRNTPTHLLEEIWRQSKQWYEAADYYLQLRKKGYIEVGKE